MSATRRQLTAITGTRAARWGALALLVRPLYLATELVVAAATTGGYSFASDSISRLGRSAARAHTAHPATS